MQIRELKNYGIEMNLMFQKIPENHPETVKKAKDATVSIIRKRIGIISMLRMLYLAGKERKRIDKIPFPVKAPLKPDTARMLKESFSGKTAMFCALAKVSDKDKAMDIMQEIMDVTAYPTAITELPEPKDFEACGDTFVAFKEYILEMFRVSKEAGIHDYRVLKNITTAWNLTLPIVPSMNI